MPERCHNHDILDMAILWLPLGRPPTATSLCNLGVDMNEFRHRLHSAVSFYRDRLAAGGRLNLDAVYCPHILDVVHELYSNHDGRNF
ncbi:hypothetical protein [Rhodococcus koreensis]|uniref:hypothetical protein n=1 Tax=Rhodococcus koreensis TaxID=99653 RepID=UPI003670B3CB